MKRLGRWFREAYYRVPAPFRGLAVNAYGYVLRGRRFGGRFRELLRWLNETQHWDPDALAAWQMGQLRRLLREVSAHVPYYRDYFREHRLSADDFRTPEDLEALPVLTKDDLRRNYRRLLHERLRAKRAQRHSTSGTTGQRLDFYRPRVAYNLLSAMAWRQYAWAQVPLGSKRATIGGRWFTQRPPYWVVNRAERQLLLSVHHLDEATVDRYLDRLDDFAPVFVQGHPSGLHFLASRILARGRGLATRLRAVCCTGETLEETERAEIGEAFGAPVFESYGTGEAVVAAQECEHHSGFHEVSELGIMEFDREETTGLHYVVGTSLWNDVMPFIRYRIEDLVELEPAGPCPCGRGLPLKIKRIVGRSDEVIYAADGRRVLPVTIRTSIKPHLAAFENYQVRQTSQEEYSVLLVGDPDRSRQARIARALQSVLGPSAKLRLVNADSIANHGGKIRNVLNLWKQARPAGDRIGSP